MIEFFRASINSYTVGETVCLFDGSNIIVELQINNPKDSSVIVSFNSHRSKPSDPMVAGWANQVLREKRNGLFFVAKDNHWFHTPDLADAIAAGLRARRMFKYAMAIGASMGAHAAIRTSKKLSIDAVLAISPQLCVAQSRAPFETRWRQDLDKLETLDAPITSATTITQIYMFHDSKNELDKQHALEIQKVINVFSIELPNSGHSSVGGILDTGGMEEVLKFGPNPYYNFRIATLIQERFWRLERVAASVVLNKAKRLSPSARVQFMSTVDKVIGAKRNRDAFSSYRASLE